MKNGLKKSIYMSAAALAFAGFAGVASQTNASAKSYAKVTSISSFKGNVVTTGSNAVGTKALTLKGAKTVKSGAALKASQDADKTGNYNFRAYSVATTNRGSVYYKVVSFDKTVRGWVYGGNVKGNFAGGVKAFATTTDATAPTGNQKATDGAQLWNAPAWTTYKVGRASEKLANGATFTVAKAVTNTKSGDLYYQIAGTKTAADGKWIAAKDVKSATTPIADNAVRINLVDKDGKTVKTIDFVKGGAKKGDTLGKLELDGSNTYAWKLSDVDKTNLQSQIDKALAGTGYTYSVANAEVALAQTVTGSEVNVALAQGNKVYATLKAVVAPANGISNVNKNFKAFDPKTDGMENYPSVIKGDGVADYEIKDGKAVLKSVPAGDANTVKTAVDAINASYVTAVQGSYLKPANMKITDLFSGTKGASYSGNDVLAYLKSHAELNVLKSAIYPIFNDNGTFKTWAQYDFTANNASAGIFGSTYTEVLYTYGTTPNTLSTVTTVAPGLVDPFA